MTFTTKNREDLKDLLKIIISTHKKGKRESGFTKPFDFSDLIPQVDYLEIKEGNKYLSSKKLMSWHGKMK